MAMLFLADISLTHLQFGRIESATSSSCCETDLCGEDTPGNITRARHKSLHVLIALAMNRCRSSGEYLPVACVLRLVECEPNEK